jgi:nicotinamidase-related amidase
MSDTAADRAERLAGLVTPSGSAVLVQEMQRGVVGTATGLPTLAEAANDVGLIQHVAAVVKAARTAGVTVVHCTAENLSGGFGVNRNARVFAAARKAGMENAPGSDSVRPVPELGPEPGDVILPRYHGLSPMTGSPLDSLLRNQGVTTVVVVGVSLNVAIPNLVFDAVNRSYQVVVVSDGVAGVPVDYGVQVLTHSLSLVATLCSTDEVVAAWAKDPG